MVQSHPAIRGPSAVWVAKACQVSGNNGIPPKKVANNTVEEHKVIMRRLDQGSDYSSASKSSFFANHLVVVAWIRMVTRIAMKVTEAMICAPGAFMPTSTASRNTTTSGTRTNLANRPE